MTTSNSPTLCVATIEWTTDDLPRETVECILGARTVRDYFAMDRKVAVGRALSRRAGWWDANEREAYAAYSSLVTLLRAS